MERRQETRKNIEALELNHIICNTTLKKFFKKGYMLNTSLTGFLVEVDRQDILQEELRSTLTLESLVGSSISFYVPQMELELDGTIKITRHKGKGIFEVLVNFSSDTPRYWRECLMDLLPQPGEMGEE